MTLVGGGGIAVLGIPTGFLAGDGCLAVPVPLVSTASLDIAWLDSLLQSSRLSALSLALEDLALSVDSSIGFNMPGL